MIALIDIGNSRAKYCTFTQGKSTQCQRSSPQRISNDLFTSEYLTKHFFMAEKLIVASVSHNKLTDKIESWCQKHNISYQHVISEQRKMGVVSAYHQPSQLGVDRWLTLIGAAKLYPSQNVLIIDAGTATTFDLLSCDGQHQGGWILAGIDTLFASVLNNTSQVQANVAEKPSLAFGVNSSENVNNATWAATVGAVNLAISQSEQQGFIIDEVLVTGGNASMLSSLLSHRCTLIEDLLFIGMQAYI